MAIIRGRSKRKPSGGRYKRVIEKKRKYKLARSSLLTKLEDRRLKLSRKKGSGMRYGLYSENSINVYDPAQKKYSVLVIKTIIENPANRHYVRRNIMTKGTIVETEKGKVLITSRPGQSNRINGILLQSK